MLSRLLSALILFALSSTWNSAARSQEVFIGNPGKSLNFSHFDLALEKGYFKELGLDFKLLNTKCDVAVTALLTGNLQKTGCVGTAVGKNGDFPPERLVDYTLLRQVQKEMGIQ